MARLSAVIVLPSSCTAQQHCDPPAIGVCKRTYTSPLAGLQTITEPPGHVCTSKKNCTYSIMSTAQTYCKGRTGPWAHSRSRKTSVLSPTASSASSACCSHFHCCFSPYPSPLWQSLVWDTQILTT